MNKKRSLAVLFMAVVIFLVSFYTYLRGVQDGIKLYKDSRAFQLTLDSMYKFGYLDGLDQKRGY